MLQMKCEDVITLGTEPFFDLGGGGPNFGKKSKSICGGYKTEKRMSISTLG